MCRGSDEHRDAATWCDGKADCPRGEDEADCPSEAPLAEVYCADNRNRSTASWSPAARPVACTPLPALIQCHDGTPRLETTRCDGVPDCPGGEDEDGCSQCYDGAVHCDARCVMASRVCDGFFDCSDGADERGCLDYLVLASTFFHPKLCGPGRFDCGGRCVDQRLVCDGVRDCDNNADEVNCNGCRPGAVPCSGRCVRAVTACHWEKTCHNASWAAGLPDDSGMCDGVLDCADGRDEKPCTNREACSALYCDGVCRPRSIVCDGVRDCQSGEDELDCPEGMPNTTTRESWRRRNHRVEFTWTYSTAFTVNGTTTNVTTVLNDTTAVITTSVVPRPDPHHGLAALDTACPHTTTLPPPPAPKRVPAPAAPVQRPNRKRGGAGSGGGRKRKRKQERRRQRKQQHESDE